jgi:hypothetical protein
MPPYSQTPQGARRAPIFPFTKQQQAIIDYIVNEDGHVVVNAGAGTGKTTLALGGLDNLPSKYNSAQYLAFNKSIASSTQAKIRPPYKAGTFHSAGYGPVRQAFPTATQGDPNPDRTWEMLPEAMPRSTRSIICKVVSICKNQLEDGTDPDRLLDLCAQYDIDLTSSEQWDDTQSTVLEWVPVIMEQSKTPTTCIDFDDMIWLPVIWNLPVKRFDFLVIDESQDLNKCQHKLSLMMGKRLLVIGDRRQAIYAWRGADSASMDTLRDILGASRLGVREFPLTVTQRCPLLVVALARTIVPDFEYPFEQETLAGKPTRLGNVCFGYHYLQWEHDYTYSKKAYPETKHTFPAGSTYNEETYFEPGWCPNDKPQLGDLVLCRTNAPLIQLAYQLIRSQIPVMIQGRDIGAGLKALVQRLVSNNSTVDQLLAAVHKWFLKESSKLAASSEARAATQLQVLQDKKDCIEALTEGLDNVLQVLSRIDVIFKNVNASQDTSSYVLLSSVHRAKGLESKVVRVIQPDLMPHPMARTPEAQEQERNLMYVAWTRSLETLHIH